MAQDCHIRRFRAITPSTRNEVMHQVHALVEPHPGAAFAEVPAPAPSPWPVALRPLAPRIAGAGREMGLEDFLATTSSTALAVVVDGTLVHEWYA
jgi:hypothetical protein